MLETLLPIALGIAGWFTAKFLADPLRKFFDLKGEVARQLTLFANVRARTTELRDDGIAGDTRHNVGDFSPEDNTRLNLAIEKYRDLASQVKGLEHSDFFASFVLKRVLGYDLSKVAQTLIGLSNSIGEYGQQRANAVTNAKSALKLGM